MKYRAKHEKQTKKNHFNKSAALLIALVLIVTVGVGSTLAYLMDNSATVTNTFTPTKVACEVYEKFDGNIKQEVKIKNISTTGDVDAYIRAAVAVTWQDVDGDVYGQKPVADTDYTIDYDLGNGWEQGSDGYYYWICPVAVNGFTGKLIDTCTCATTKTVGDKTYYLSVEIIAEAIQAEPTTAVTSSWSSGVSDVNGTTLLIKQ